jgi:ABC-2 type transport system ATP-binding protein
MSTIKIEGITKFYGQQKALDDVTLSINKGEVVGLLGPNGAGKSTLMKILTTVIPPSSGSAQVNGLDIQEQSLDVRKCIGYLPELNPLYTDMYVREYLNFVYKSYPNQGKSKAAVEEVIQLTGLSAESRKRIGELSKGYRQRVGLAQALIHDPEILILDEPTSGLDPNQLVEIRRIIADLGKKKTIILSTHIMQEVEALCSRVIIIDQGKIVADDTPANLSKNSSQAFTYRLELKEAIDKKQLKTIEGVAQVDQVSETVWLITGKKGLDLREKVFKFAVSKNYNVLALSQESSKMEDVFHRLTHEGDIPKVS